MRTYKQLLKDRIITGFALLVLGVLLYIVGYLGYKSYNTTSHWTVVFWLCSFIFALAMVSFFGKYTVVFSVGLPGPDQLHEFQLNAPLTIIQLVAFTLLPYYVLFEHLFN